MSKVGRNEPCPCGSGIKFKRCCLRKEQEQPASRTQVQQARISLQQVISQIQEAAAQGEQKLLELGVFVLVSIPAGDAWLLEVTESDAMQVAAGGESLPVDLKESQETIEVNWSHTFAIQDNQFVLTAYKDKMVQTFDNYPAAEISGAMKRIKKKYSPELLESVHIASEQPE